MEIDKLEESKRIDESLLKLLEHGVCDEAGNAIWNRDRAVKMMEHSPKIMLRIAEAVKRETKLTETDSEEMEKNSGKTPSSTSSTN